MRLRALFEDLDDKDEFSNCLYCKEATEFGSYINDMNDFHNAHSVADQKWDQYTNDWNRAMSHYGYSLVQGSPFGAQWKGPFKPRMEDPIPQP